jgi:hypothetical protein
MDVDAWTTLTPAFSHGERGSAILSANPFPENEKAIDTVPITDGDSLGLDAEGVS